METVELLAFKGARPLLETLLAYPKRQFSINELSKTSHLPFTSTWKLVNKFEKAQIVDVTLIGKSRAVEYKESPFSMLAARIMQLSTTPQRLSLDALKAALKARSEIKEAYLFGSVAANKEKLESDIDVAILATRSVDAPALMTAMADRYGVNVVPLVFKSKKEFDNFLKDKKKVKLA